MLVHEVISEIEKERKRGGFCCIGANEVIVYLREFKENDEVTARMAEPFGKYAHFAKRFKLQVLGFSRWFDCRVLAENLPDILNLHGNEVHIVGPELAKPIKIRGNGKVVFSAWVKSEVLVQRQKLPTDGPIHIFGLSSECEESLFAWED